MCVGGSAMWAGIVVGGTIFIKPTSARFQPIPAGLALHRGRSTS